MDQRERVCESLPPSFPLRMASVNAGRNRGAALSSSPPVSTSAGEVRGAAGEGNQVVLSASGSLSISVLILPFPFILSSLFCASSGADLSSRRRGTKKKRRRRGRRKMKRRSGAGLAGCTAQLVVREEGDVRDAWLLVVCCS